MKRILLVDDEEGFGFFVRANLELNGDYRVIVATDGKEGLKAAHAIHPDLILLDLTMPRLNGFDILKRLKEDMETAAIPVLVVTARTDEDSKRKAIGLYNDDYIEKPVEVDVLRARIEKTLSRLKRRQGA